MYQGFGKGDGGVVGGDVGEEDDSDFSEICESASAEESFVCRGTNDFGEEADMMFSARLCPESGDVIWVREESESGIMERTVGMSQMTSMLHDKDRNDVYERALQASIKSFQKTHDRDPIVFDIGTGTGLLSMFASRHGAEFVIGCEMFEAMAKIAEEVIATNNLSDKINVIPMKSTSIESIAPLRPDILVSELLDSALLGEGCMYSHADAIKRFMDDKDEQTNISGEYDMLSSLSQRVMPYSAEIFATLVESEETKHMHDVSNIKIHQINPFRNESARSCPGGWPLIPVHWREIASRGGRLLSDPQEVLNFEFFHTFKDESDRRDDGKENENMEDENEPYSFGEGCFNTEISVTESGTIHSIMLWWKVYLLSPEIDPDRVIWYSTKPDVMNWQDHWLQVVFPLPQDIDCVAGDVITITAAHDNLRIWLKAEKIDCVNILNEENQPKKAKTNECSIESKSNIVSNVPNIKNRNFIKKQSVPSSERLLSSQCCCGWHLLCGPERIQALNDTNKNLAWENAITKLIDQIQLHNYFDSGKVAEIQNMNIILDVSDGSLLSIATALELKLRAGKRVSDSSSSQLKVVSVEGKQFSRIFHDQLVAANNLEDLMMIWDGVYWGDVPEYFVEEDKEIEDDEPANEVENYDKFVPLKNGNKNTQTPKIAALISECFYYQLHALPTWQALSFHYKRTELEGKMEKNALILPGKAFIMAAAVELTDLANTYGKAGIISGFDHTPLDKKQENWHQHMFPYKLGGYRKRFLSKPIIIATLDYSSCVSSSEFQTHTCLTDDGRCDCVAVWVDYDLTPVTANLTPSASGLRDSNSDGVDRSISSSPNILHQWDDISKDFPSHLKVNLKFFEAPSIVQKNKTFLSTSSTFHKGDSDFKYEFKII